MIPVSYQIHIKKEVLKFSSAHMTVFPDGTKESLHGHNYATDVTLKIRDNSLASFVSFSYFKKLLEQLCSQWHSKVLIAKNCPFIQIQKQDLHEIDFLLCGKHYVFPMEDVELLPLENISVECLTELFCKTFASQIKEDLIGKVILGVQVRIEETPGQGATIALDFSEGSTQKASSR
jgi:6-pyruvoyltetrahydropterin/6-carboxytetrahydropterin synthase